VLTDVERVDPDAVGEDGLLDGVANDDVTAERSTELIDTHIDGRIQSELNLPFVITSSLPLLGSQGKSSATKWNE